MSWWWTRVQRMGGYLSRCDDTTEMAPSPSSAPLLVGHLLCGDLPLGGLRFGVAWFDR